MNCTFPFAPGSPKEAEFKNSKRGMFLKTLPKFSTTSGSDLVTSISSSPLVHAPMSLALKRTLDHVPVGVIERIDKDLINFVVCHIEDSYLLGNELWDDNFTNHTTTELWHFQLKKTDSSRQLM